MPETTEANHVHYQKHLDRVSRSFAFCIAQLPLGLRENVGLTYLLCRVLDTVEDADWNGSSGHVSENQQQRQFEVFNRMLTEPLPVAEIQNWSEAFPASVPENEKELLADLPRLIQDWWRLPPPLRLALTPSILSMSHGMNFFMKRKERGVLRLKNLHEVNRYCFFVAGVVGEMLTQLLRMETQTDTKIDDEVDVRSDRSAGRATTIDSRSLIKAYHFGLFLQKVNLLKDQKQDELSGRFLIPSRSEVFGSLRENAFHALDYILETPVKYRGYRLFCAWSLFLGMASLPWIEADWQATAGSKFKISREETQALLGEIEAMIDDNEALRSNFEHAWSFVPQAETPVGQSLRAKGRPTDFPDFSKLYSGALDISQLDQLGLVSSV